MSRTAATVILGSLLLAAPALAQVVNGDFETGSLAPWVMSNTAAGGAVASGVGLYDIDGPGPHPSSQCASFIAGRTGPSLVPEGVQLTQSVTLSATRRYRMGFRWAVNAVVNVFNANGGFFDVLVDGVSIAQSVAPITVAGHTDYGSVSAIYRPSHSGVFQLGASVRRNAGAGEEVVEFIDDIITTPLCPADLDDGSGAGAPDDGVTIDDLLFFLPLYGAGDLRADLDNGSMTGTRDQGVTIEDLLYFLAHFAAGC